MLYNFFKLAIRTLRRQRWYTFLNVLGLSLGIAGGLLLFQFITYHLGFDRYHRKAGQLYRVVSSLHLADGSVVNEPGAPLDISASLKEQIPEVRDYAVLLKVPTVTVGVSGANGHKFFTEKETLAFATLSWFSLFDYTWLKGNPSLLQESHTAVVTRRLAAKYFGNEDPIGKTISLDNAFTATITGVLEDLPANTDLQTELFLSRASFTSWHPEVERQMHASWGFINSWAQSFVWLPAGVSGGKIGKAIDQLKAQHFGADLQSVYQFHLQPLKEIHFDARFGDAMRSSLLVTLAIIATFLVLIACFNFVNLATAQSGRRAQEIGTRKVLGGTAASIFWQFMIETACIVLLAAALSLVWVCLALPVFRDWLQTRLPFDLLRDRRLQSFLLLLTFFVTVVAGAYPALIVSRWKPVSALKQQVVGSVFALLRKGLVVLQHVVVQALIICTLIITLQVRYVKNVDPGFNKESVVMVPVPDTSAGKQSWLKQRLVTDPAIRSVSFCYTAPLTGEKYMAGSVSYDARAWEDFASRSIPADSGFLHTFQLQLLAGRNIRSGDSSHEVLINETLLHKFGFHAPAQVIGHRIVNGALGDLPTTVVGVVKDFNVQPLYGELLPVMITPFSPRYNYAAIKLGGGRQEEVRQAIQKAWQATYPDKVFEYHYVNEEMDSFYHKDDLLNKLIDVTALVAIIISCLGLSGLISFFAARRTREIGIRKVLGATVPGIVYLLSKDFLIMVAEALLVAVPVAWYFMNEWLHNFAYRIAIGWWIFALAGLLSTLIALCTVGYQSIRAALVNPAKSLRSEG